MYYCWMSFSGLLGEELLLAQELESGKEEGLL
jgi:hypothetical protein